MEAEVGAVDCRTRFFSGHLDDGAAMLAEGAAMLAEGLEIADEDCEADVEEITGIEAVVDAGEDLEFDDAVEVEATVDAEVGVIADDEGARAENS